jgi:predicted transcriptional regulator
MAKEIKTESPVQTYKKTGEAGLRKKRISREIILDILQVLSEEKKIKKSRIMQKAYLDWKTFRKDFDFLLEKDFIAKCNEPEVGCYELTKKGEELLKRLKEVEKLLQ